MLKIEIDDNSGFCFGVTTAIKKAEEELSNGGTLYCLGDIVHNNIECDRLKRIGLITIDHDTYRELHNAKVLLRAHGEPPETYEIAKRNNLELIDATCPVVLKLQQRIKQKWQETAEKQRQIIIHGQTGHAEVLGLVLWWQYQAVVVRMGHNQSTHKTCRYAPRCSPYILLLSLLVCILYVESLCEVLTEEV